jgi:hypothetical protein
MVLIHTTLPLSSNQIRLLKPQSVVKGFQSSNITSRNLTKGLDKLFSIHNQGSLNFLIKTPTIVEASPSPRGKVLQRALSNRLMLTRSLAIQSTTKAQDMAAQDMAKVITQATTTIERDGDALSILPGRYKHLSTRCHHHTLNS